jgi:hypothetical protein
MKRINTWLQNLQPLKIFSIFLALTFLFLAQAFNRSSIAGETPQPPAKPPNVKIYDPTKDYPISPYQAGMNNFSDVDDREREAEKTGRYRENEVIENYQRNQENKGINSTDQYIRNYREETPFSEGL